MESNFSNRDFEQFVKQNADQYRMFPSEKVWKGVNSVLHTRKRWYGFWLGVLLLVSGGAVTWVMTAYPTSGKPNETSVKNNLSTIPAAGQTATASESSPIIENLLSFNKQPLVAKDITPVQKDLGIFDVALPLAQHVDDIQTADTRDFSEIRTEREFSPIINKLSISKNDLLLNTSAVPVFILPHENVISLETEKSPATNNDKLSQLGDIAINQFTIESIVNAYQFKKAPKKISWQLFVTPTISYRKLSVNKSFDNLSASNYPFAYLSDVNSAVTHKPDLGLQIGLSGHYPIAKNLKLRGGFQFNINRYDIKAYAYRGEVATIDLNGGPGNNTISTWTNYRNYSGYRSDWLKNFYFSFSAPVGVELKLFGNRKTNVGVAGTLQPTYMLSDRAYLISTDYKNYAEVPRLIRHVNLNTSFETFINYTKGKTKWQIGPQVRYQLLSSFHNKYPVKENLFDFGVKVGVMLTK